MTIQWLPNYMLLLYIKCKINNPSLIEAKDFYILYLTTYWNAGNFSPLKAIVSDWKYWQISWLSMYLNS